MEDNTCCLESCGNKVHRRALCSRHYRIASKAGILFTRAFIGPQWHCDIEGCERPRRKEYKICRMHSHRNYRDGSHGPASQVIADKTPMVVGSTYGQLTVTEYAGNGHWRCTCECGDDTLATADNLHRGRAVRCADLDAHFSPSYTRAHKRIAARMGRAGDKSCVDCGGMAADWSYNYGAPDQAHDEREGYMPYSMTPAYYSPRCKSCHKIHDLAMAA